jgi:hypothetical protein
LACGRAGWSRLVAIGRGGFGHPPYAPAVDVDGNFEDPHYTLMAGSDWNVISYHSRLRWRFQ